jgi:hypothetical protein
MVASPHALIALLSYRVVQGKLPAAGYLQSIAIGATSHFLADRIPHGDYSLTGVKGKCLLSADLALMTAGILRYRRSKLESIAALAGAGVDGWVLAERALGYNYLNRLHDKTHTTHELPPFLAFAEQLALLLGVSYLLEKKK